MKIIPANPDFELLLINANEARLAGPIIAWRIDAGDGLILPITDSLVVPETMADWAVIRPDGSVLECEGEVYDSMDHFQRELAWRAKQAPPANVDSGLGLAGAGKDVSEHTKEAVDGLET